MREPHICPALSVGVHACLWYVSMLVIQLSNVYYFIDCGEDSGVCTWVDWQNGMSVIVTSIPS